MNSATMKNSMIGNLSCNAGVRAVSVGFAVLAAMSAMATDRVFPKAGGDLASASDWGAAVPGSGDAVVLHQSGTYTLSDDVTFNCVTGTAAETVFDFTGHRIKIIGEGFDIGRRDSFWMCGDGAQVTWKGGEWDFNGYQRLLINACSNYRFTITDGCIVTNVGTFTAADRASGAKVVWSNGAKLFAKELRMASGIMKKLDASVEGGAELHVTDVIYHDVACDVAYRKKSGGNTLEVSGAGSKIVGSFTYRLGWLTPSNAVRIVNGACYESSGKLSIGRDGLDILAENEFYVGANSAATFSELSFAGRGNRFIVENGAVTTTTFTLLTNSTVAVSGADTRLDISRADVFGTKARDSRFVFADGVSYHAPAGGNWEILNSATNCEFVVTGAGTSVGSDAEYEFVLGSGNTTACRGNTIKVLDGATLYGKKIRITGYSNNLIVSNATVSTSATQTGGLMLGYSYNSTTGKGANCLCVLQGTTPRVISSQQIWIRNGATLRFEIPAEGYADGYVPVTTSAGSLNLDTTTVRLEVDVSRFQPKHTTKLTLFAFADSLSTANENWFLAQEMPEGCSLSVIDHKKVVLRRRVNQGFAIIVR